VWSFVVLFSSCRVLCCSCCLFVCVTCFSYYRSETPPVIAKELSASRLPSRRVNPGLIPTPSICLIQYIYFKLTGRRHLPRPRESAGPRACPHGTCARGAPGLRRSMGLPNTSCSLGRSGPNLEPGTLRVHFTNGPRNGLNIDRKVGPCTGSRRRWVLTSVRASSQALHAANTYRPRFQVRT